jgi:osmoprotectant transport system ATP-binding protein
VIRLEGVSKVFLQDGQEPVHAVRSLDLEVARGETVCLSGARGCGKTTTLRLINRLSAPTDGRVLVGGEDTRTLDPIRLRRRMGYVIQRGGLFPHLTVRENVVLLCRLEGHDARAARRRGDELLEMVHLPPDRFGDRRPRELSGGQRQRVGVARARALDPEIVLMDEPFGALDPITRSQVQEEFQELKRRVEKTVVIVTHDLEEAFLLGDRVGLMDGGRLLQLGTLEDFRAAPRTKYVERFLAKHLHAN